MWNVKMYISLFHFFFCFSSLVTIREMGNFKLPPFEYCVHGKQQIFLWYAAGSCYFTHHQNLDHWKLSHRWTSMIWYQGCTRITELRWQDSVISPVLESLADYPVDRADRKQSRSTREGHGHSIRARKQQIERSAYIKLSAFRKIC